MYRVRVKKPDQTLLREEIVETKRYVYPFADNVADNGGTPIRTILVEVEEIDSSGNTSDVVAVTILNPPPPAPTTITTQFFQDVGLKVKPSLPNDRDIAGMKVWMSETNGFSPDLSNLVYDGADLDVSIPVGGAGTYYLRVALHDNFDKTNYNVSAQFTVNVAPNAMIVQIQSDITALQSAINGIDAQAIQELQTRVTQTEDDIEALSSAVTTVTATANNASATASQALTAVADTNGKLQSTWQVTLGAGNKISGIKGFNDGQTSSFDILADRFSISNPAGAGAITPFRVEGGTVYINEANITKLAADNFASNAGVSAGGVYGDYNFPLTESITDIPNMTNLIREFDEDGVALVILYILIVPGSSNSRTQIYGYASNITDGTRALHDGQPMIDSRHQVSTAVVPVMGFALLNFSSGSTTFNFRGRSLGGNSQIIKHRLAILHFKNANFSGVTNFQGNTGPWGPTY